MIAEASPDENDYRLRLKVQQERRQGRGSSILYTCVRVRR